MNVQTSFVEEFSENNPLDKNKLGELLEMSPEGYFKKFCYSFTVHFLLRKRISHFKTYFLKPVFIVLEDKELGSDFASDLRGNFVQRFVEYKRYEKGEQWNFIYSRSLSLDSFYDDHNFLYYLGELNSSELFYKILLTEKFFQPLNFASTRKAVKETVLNKEG